MVQLHIIGNTNIPVSRKYECCAYNMFAIKLAEDLSSYYEVNLYGTSDDDEIVGSNKYNFHQLTNIDFFNKIKVNFNSGEWLSFNNSKEIEKIKYFTTDGLKTQLLKNVKKGDIIVNLYLIYLRIDKIFTEDFCHVIIMYYFSGVFNYQPEWRNNILASPHTFNNLYFRNTSDVKLDGKISCEKHKHIVNSSKLIVDSSKLIVDSSGAVCNECESNCEECINLSKLNAEKIMRMERKYCYYNRFTLENEIDDNSEYLPPYYDEEDFDFQVERNRKRKTFLYLGRIQESKGVTIIFELAKTHPDYDFIIAGEGKIVDGKLEVEKFLPDQKVFLYYDLIEYPNIEFIGFIGGKEKIKLIKSVACLIQPSRYLEPFGLNVLEAAFCGIPSITPADGGFTISVPKELNFLQYERHNLPDKLIVESISKIMENINDKLIGAKEILLDHCKTNFDKKVVIPKIVNYIEKLIDSEVKNLIEYSI